MESSVLNNLSFTDLFVCLNNGEACYQVSDVQTRRTHLIDLPVTYKDDLSSLLSAYIAINADGADCNIKFRDLSLRAIQLPPVEGLSWVVFQPIAKQPRQLDTLGFTPAVVKALQGLGQREGLVLICGGISQGKTTTAAALLNDYLHRYGGVACTLEDPVEYKFSGRQGGAGLCYQFDIQKKQDWELMLARSLQVHARYLLVSELRAPEIANQVLRSATSGQLVITNIHAGTLEEGIEGLLHFAERTVGDHAPILLASALTAVVHQHMTSFGFQARMLIVEQGSHGDSCRTFIRERRVGQITSIVDQQMARLK